MGVKDELAGQASSMITEAYKDLVQPSAKPIGTVASLLPRTVRLWFGKWERWVINGEESLEKTAEAIRDKIKDTPVERLCEPESFVALPAIQQISYCYDSSELRNMYANLLATSMDSAFKDSVHPSYVEIIKQLSPDEAKLLVTLPHDTRNATAVIDLRIEYGSDKGFETIFRNYTFVGIKVCQYKELIPSYLDNLCRLKLIEIPDDSYLVYDDMYTMLSESTEMQRLKRMTPLPDGASFGIHKKIMYVTNFGLGFIRCCVDDYMP